MCTSSRSCRVVDATEFKKLLFTRQKRKFLTAFVHSLYVTKPIATMAADWVPVKPRTMTMGGVTVKVRVDSKDAPVYKAEATIVPKGMKGYTESTAGKRFTVHVKCKLSQHPLPWLLADPRSSFVSNRPSCNTIRWRRKVCTVLCIGLAGIVNNSFGH